MAMVPTVGHLGEADMFVEITDIHRSVAQDAADRASETIDRYQLCDSAGYRRPDRLPSWDGHYLGALAEIIVSDATGLPWGQYDYGRVDVGDDIEVRRVQRPDTGPIIRPKDYADDRIRYHVAVYLPTDAGHAFILGWCHTAQGWEHGHQCATVNAGRCCYRFTDSNSVRINPRHLRHISTLKGSDQ